MQTFYYLAAIAVMLVLVWLVMRGLDIPLRDLKRERRKADFYRAYNEIEDRTETIFDQRQK